jgi:hypothetical protein
VLGVLVITEVIFIANVIVWGWAWAVGAYAG